MPIPVVSGFGSVTPVRRETAFGGAPSTVARVGLVPPLVVELVTRPQPVDVPDPGARCTSGRLWAALEDVAGNGNTVQNANELLARRSAGLSDRIIHENDDELVTEIRGVPEYVRHFEHQGVVFRHYFADQAQMDAALVESRLVAGPVSYAQTSAGARTYFRDLTGVFLTLPEYAPDSVGVPGRTCYVDLVLPADTGVVEIEPGIFLVPGPPKTPDWLAQLVRDHQAGRDIPRYARDAVLELIRSGGVREPVVASFSVS